MKVSVKYQCKKPSLRVRHLHYEVENFTDLWKKLPDHLKGELISITITEEKTFLREDLPEGSVDEIERLAGVKNAVS